MTRLAKQLWAGEVPLASAFWRYAVLYGFLVNAFSSGLLLILLVRDAPLVLVAVAFALPLPYNLLAIVAVWRSADRYQGQKSHAEIARIVTVIWMIALTIM